MNTKVLTMAVLAAALSFASCNDKKEAVEETSATEIVDSTTTSSQVAETSVDSTNVTPVATTEHKDGDTLEITGEVTEINQGKDGYTAKLKTAEGKAYAATISIPNLDNPKQYKASKVGDKITVKGVVTNLESDVLIRVKELK